MFRCAHVQQVWEWQLLPEIVVVIKLLLLCEVTGRTDCKTGKGSNPVIFLPPSAHVNGSAMSLLHNWEQTVAFKIKMFRHRSSGNPYSTLHEVTGESVNKIYHLIYY